MDLILGLDIGTTEVKAMTWDANQQRHTAVSRKVHLVTPQAGWVEQDAKELWAAAAAACFQAAAHAHSHGNRICAISVSTQGGTTIPVDEMGEPTRFAFSWMDERAAKQADEVGKNFGIERIYQTTGWPLTPGLPLNQIAWLRQNQPGVFQRTARFMFVNDYILYQLGGELVMDPSNAGITQLYNLAHGNWDQALLRLAGIRQEQLSSISPSGALAARVTRAAAGLTGLTSGTPIFNGAHDQYCAALGVGVVNPGDVLLSCGTAWVLLFVIDQLTKGLEQGVSVSPHPIAGIFGGILDIGGVGSTMEWLIDVLWDASLERGTRFALLEQAVLASPPGANGLLFIPLSGGYVQPGQALNRGPAGLALSHGRSEIARGVMEGIAFELDLLLADTVKKIPIQRLVMIGGASRNPHWPQMIADITGLPVSVPDVKGAASLGAAILAGKAMGWYTGNTPGAAYPNNDRKEYLPGLSALNMYAQVKARYRQVRTKPV